MKDRILEIIEHYFGRYKPSGPSDVTLKCPFHKGGQENRPSFGINIETGVGNCFSCGTRGSLLYLLNLRGLSKEEIDSELGDLKSILIANAVAAKERRAEEWLLRDPFMAHPILPDKLQAVYGRFFPTNLVNLGFDVEVLRSLGVGFDTLNNRVMYPIRDLYGNLAGFVGGASNEYQEPKYKVYQGRRKDHIGRTLDSDYGSWFDEEFTDYSRFRNHEHIWNFERVYPQLIYGKEAGTLIIVEGFKACMWLLQHGYWNTVALMGSKIFEKQRLLLSRLNSNFVLFLDNDKAGIDGTTGIGQLLYQKHGVYCAEYPLREEAHQPTDLSQAELSIAINMAISYPEFRRRKAS
jgi:DNA primase